MKKKSVIALLTIITSLTLTACSFQFKTNAFTTQVPEKTQIIHVDVAKELSDIIDHTDFSNEYSLDTLTEELSGWANSYAEDSEYLGEFQKATLVRVVDGDTIIVNIENKEYTIRLIGINTPESVHPNTDRNTEEGIASSEYTKSLLANIETVYLQKDISETDKYGRLLRYVWLEMPENSNAVEEIANKMLNGILLKEGVAEVATYEPDTTYQSVFEDIQGEK